MLAHLYGVSLETGQIVGRFYLRMKESEHSLSECRGLTNVLNFQNTLFREKLFLRAEGKRERERENALPLVSSVFTLTRHCPVFPCAHNACAPSCCFLHYPQSERNP